MSGLFEDVRFATRLLRKQPGFAAVAILTLALGIGANAAIFSLVRGVLLKPLGYPEADRLLFISSQFPGLGFDQFWISPPEYFDLKERSRSFSSIGAFRVGAANVGTVTEPRRAISAIVTADLFTALGVAPMIGRTFTEAETLPNAAPAVVLAHRFWRTAFSADSSIVGRTIEVDGAQATVVGVMPPGFDVYDARLEVFQPAPLDPANRRSRGSHFLYLIGRLAPGVTREQALVELETLLGSWKDVAGGMHAPSRDNHRLRYDPLLTQMVGGVARALLVLQVAVICVLLIACANLANLLLARSETRQREFAVRAALGADRGRLLRQFAVEGVLLSLMGAAFGVALAWLAVWTVRSTALKALPRVADVALDWTVFGFALVLAVLTGIVFGLAPMLHFRDAIGHVLKESGSRTSTTRGRVRRTLVVGEMAVAVVLLVGALLLLRTFWNLTQVNAGFPRERLATFGLVLPPAKYPDPQQVAAFFERLLDRLNAQPGVERVAAMSGLPPSREVNANDTAFEGIQPEEGKPPHNVDYYQTVTVGYLETMGIRVVDGRGFEPADATSNTPVVLVNQMMANRFWPGQSPIGRRVRPSGPDTIPWFTVVGVVADVKQGGVAEPVGSELYFSYEQGARVQFAPRNMNVVVRTALAPETLAATVRRETAALDPSLPVVNFRSMEEVFDETLNRPRLLARLLAGFAVLALLLAVIGTYGVLAYIVAERRREIGVRMALGADRARVLRMVLRDGMALAGIGAVVGLGAALLATRVLRSMLYGVTPSDPVTLTTVAGAMLLVALAACAIPARRASSVDPMLVLREE